MTMIDTKQFFNGTTHRVDVITKYLQHHFLTTPTQQLYSELISQGLDNGNENVPVLSSIWDDLKITLDKLIKNWHGPDVPVYILPASEECQLNAVCYEECICMFVRNEYFCEKLEAILTHEYNHFCRFQFHRFPKTTEDKLIAEGLAQFAVKTMYGEHMLEDWVNTISLDQAYKIWDTLSPIIRKNSLIILFGHKDIPLPDHFGYAFGYQLVMDYANNHPNLSIKELLTIDTSEFFNK